MDTLGTRFEDFVARFGALVGGAVADEPRILREGGKLLRELVTRYPESRYAPEARARMRQLVDAQARGEVNIARFYYTRHAYVAAISRAQNVLRDFQSTPYAQDALRIMVDSYAALGLSELQADTQRVLDLNFPQGAARRQP